MATVIIGSRWLEHGDHDGPPMPRFISFLCIRRLASLARKMCFVFMLSVARSVSWQIQLSAVDQLSAFVDFGSKFKVKLEQIGQVYPDRRAILLSVRHQVLTAMLSTNKTSRWGKWCGDVCHICGAACDWFSAFRMSKSPRMATGWLRSMVRFDQPYVFLVLRERFLCLSSLCLLPKLFLSS